MGAANASINIQTMIAQALNAQGNAVGLQLGYPLSNFLLSVNQRRAQSYTLVNANDTQVIDFGSGTGASFPLPQVLILSSTQTFAWIAAFTGSAATTIDGNLILVAAGSGAHPMTSGTIFCRFAGTVVDVILAG